MHMEILKSKSQTPVKTINLLNIGISSAYVGMNDFKSCIWANILDT